MPKAGKLPKVQPIRMYLIKTAIKTYRDALRDHMEFTEYDFAPNLKQEGAIFLRKPIERPITWIRFLQEGVQESLPTITSMAHAAVLFLEVDKRTLAVVFGMGRYMLKDTSYEADFGIIAALNSIAPDGIRSADTFLFEALAVHKRTQTSKTSSIADFEIDTTREHVRSITGKAKGKTLVERVTGTEGGFGANARISFPDLVDLCSNAIKAYRSKDYQTTFPRFDNLQRVSDSQKLKDLDALLLSLLGKRNTAGICLSPPEPLEYDDFSGFSMTPKGEIFDELSIDVYLDSRVSSPLSIDLLKNHRVFLRKETADEPLGRWSIYKSLICEFPDSSTISILMNGEWYRVSSIFAQQVRDAIAKIPEVSLGLPALGTFKTEPEYLEAVTKHGKGLIVLDRKLAQCEDAGRPIEVCDILTGDRDFVHVKRRDGGSATLSHLFMQGRNSALALLRDSVFREETRKHLAKHGTKAVARVPKDKPATGSFRVVYGIMGTKPGTVASSLPFFSQLTLMDTAQKLAERGVDVALCPIS
jgi:uncharacterized protein (TIGR04141 family)